MNRGSVWSEKEVRDLINVWGERKIQEELDGAVRNKTVFQHVSEKMSAMGHRRDWEQCRTKIKNLKKEYRTVKDSNGETGRGRKTCRFYAELDNYTSLSLKLIHTQDAEDPPPQKRKKTEKKTKGEKAVQKALESFSERQREAEERFQRYEEERWQKELDVEERRRKEDREHEMRMMAMLGQMFQGRESFNFEEYPSTYYQQ